MSNNEIALKLIDKLRDYLKKLKQLQKHSEQEFLTDWRVEWQICRGFQLAIESSIDLGQEIIAGLKLKKPFTYGETFVILRGAKVVSKSISERMQFLAKFRNKLVHDYLFLDPENTYKTFQEYFPYIEKFLLEIENYLKK